VNSIELILRIGAIPVIGLTLPESFFTPSSPWVIAPGGVTRGLHAVVCVGIGNYLGGRVILVRNSWGISWGDGGHAWLDEPFLIDHLREVLVLETEVAA
jgi:hypothetical protein